MVADVSRQVLDLEVAYAAFCGITNIVVTSPAANNSNSNTLPANATKFAHAIRHLLSLSPHVQINILVSLGFQCQGEQETRLDYSATTSSQRLDRANTTDQERSQLSSWRFWDTVRSVCRYKSRLSVGKRKRFTPLMLPLLS